MSTNDRNFDSGKIIMLNGNYAEGNYNVGTGGTS